MKQNSRKKGTLSKDAKLKELKLLKEAKLQKKSKFYADKSEWTALDLVPLSPHQVANIANSKVAIFILVTENLTFLPIFA